MPHRTVSLAIVTVLLPLLTAQAVRAETPSTGPAYLNLGGAWQVVREGTSEVIPATVPGCIHTDLLAAKKIPDPFFRDNERAVQWIGEANWVYSRTFDVDPKLLAREHVLLRCEGLDTLATVRVNGQEVGKTDNMFRTYEFDVKKLLKPGKNAIEIRFASVLPYIREKDKARHLPTWNYPGSSYVRKEPCNFGWDWGPTLITCGIWRDISLVAFDIARITDVAITQDHSRKGKVKLTVDVGTSDTTHVALLASVDVFGDDSLDRMPLIASVDAGDFKNGHAQVEITLDARKLWWPAGMGDQPLYYINVDLTGGGRIKPLDSVTKRIGLRTLRAIEQTPTMPMHFEVNGVPFFAKGANWIPADSFAPRVTPEKLRRYVADAAECNMNCLRLWGGGYYGDDALFDACDEKGICLWVDMKFACATYPAFDPAFMANVKQEADDNIRRLRNHPSIALFCGNNEIMFLRGPNSADANKWTDDKMSYSDYYKLFRDTLGGEVHALAPETDYVTGSPDCGDVHFWQVWHGGKPFEAYRDCHGFMSEFGFQAFAEPKTVAAFTAPADRDSVYSAAMKHHERSNRGYLDVAEDGTIGTDKIMLGVRRYFREPKDFESTLWLSQIVQAYGIQLGAEGWRREMPRSMGCVFWQYNDCWPCTSWSSVDYFGRWKALQYAAKRFYAPVLVSGVADAKKGTVDVYVTNDKLEAEKLSLEVDVTTVSGKSLSSERQLALEFPARTSKRVQALALNDEIKAPGAKNLLIWLTLKDRQGKTVSENLVTFVNLRELDLLDPKLKAEVTEQKGDFRVKITAAHPALWTWLSFDGFDARCSQNFIHIRADAPAEIVVHPSAPISREAFVKGMRVRSLYDTYGH